MKLMEFKAQGIDSTLLEIYDNQEKAKILNGVRGDLLDKLEIQDGELVYIRSRCTDEEIKWFEEIGIKEGYNIDAIVTTIVRTDSPDIIKEVKQGYDLILILDISSSMTSVTTSGNSRYNDMFKVVNNIVKEVMESNELNRIGIVTFDYNSKVFIPLDHYSIKNDTNKNFFNISDDPNNNSVQIRDSVVNSKGQNWTGFTSSNMLSSGSGTYTQRGIRDGASILLNAANDSERLSSKFKDNVPGIILLTDGEPQSYSKNHITVTPTESSTGDSSSDTVNCGFYTIKTAKYYKDELEKAYSETTPMFFTIGIGMNTSSSSFLFRKMILNPNETNMTAASASTHVNTKALYNMLIAESSSITAFDYATESSIGDFNSSDLLQSVISQYIGKLEEYTKQVKSTGIFQSESIITVENEKVNVVIDGSKDIEVSVRAEFMEKQSDGTYIGTGIVNEQKSSFQLDKIRKDQIPNLKYSNGKIIWYLRNEYREGQYGLADIAITKVSEELVNRGISKESGNIVITNVIISYYIKPAV